MTRTKRGMLIATVAMFSYIPLAGVMTSYSSVSDDMIKTYGLSDSLSSALNSVAFGITVGLCPFSSLLFLKFGYRPIAMVGYIGSALSLLACATFKNQWVLFFSYSIVFAAFNNFTYNSITSIVGAWLDGTSWVASGTVLVSCGISLGTFCMNPLTMLLEKYFPESEDLVYYRFLLTGTYILFGGALFYFVSDEPPKKDAEKSEMADLKTEEVTEKKKLMDFSVFSNFNVWKWLIATTLWSLMFTVPLTNGVDIITKFYTYTETAEINGTISEITLPMNKDQATKILTANGFIELFIRFLCIAIGPKLPKWAGSYGFIYAVCCTMMGGLVYVGTTGSSQFLAWALFSLLPIPVGVMNGMIFGGTANIFGGSLVTTVWPFTNVLLAVGFTLGPIVFTVIKDMFDIMTALRIFAVIALIGAAVMAWLGISVKKQSKST